MIRGVRPGEEVDAAAWGDARATSNQNRARRQSRRERDRAQRKTPKAAAARTVKLKAAEENIRNLYAEAKRNPSFTATEWQFIECHAKGSDRDAELLQNAEFDSCFRPSRGVAGAQPCKWSRCQSGS